MMAKNEVKTRYSDTELAEFKELISGKLDKAKKDLEIYLDQLRNTSNNEDAKVRGLDDGIVTRQNEQITLLATRQKKHIKHLENALLRIENKVYGICRITNKLISKERLRAVPHATLSIEAKQNQGRR